MRSEEFLRQFTFTIPDHYGYVRKIKNIFQILQKSKSYRKYINMRSSYPIHNFFETNFIYPSISRTSSLNPVSTGIKLTGFWTVLQTYPAVNCQEERS